MQLLPETAQRFAVANVFDPSQNIDAGTRYLKELLELYKQDLRLTLAAYNAGPDRVEQFRGVPPFAETVSYVRHVTQAYSAHKTRATPPKKN
jgi:soluble lytic murein transglycosylase-like protein